MNRAISSRIEISWAACPRWATSASSDLVDAVEMLGGGWAIIFIDVQGSGSSGRSLAANLMHEIRQHLANGVTQITAVRATHQHLFAFRKGRVGASIHVCAADASAATLTISGFGKIMIATRAEPEWSVNELESPEAGFEISAEPATITVSLPLEGHVVIANDGVARGSEDLAHLLAGGDGVANNVIAAALNRDHGRARSDLAVASIARGAEDSDDRVLRGCISIPARHIRVES